jgi:hypothetical protein
LGLVALDIGYHFGLVIDASGIGGLVHCLFMQILWQMQCIKNRESLDNVDAQSLLQVDWSSIRSRPRVGLASDKNILSRMIQTTETTE